MAEIKHAIVDIAITLLIVVAVVTEMEWAWWIIVIYTPIMLLMKIVAVAGSGGFRKLKTSRGTPPVWLLHVLYGINVVALGLAAWWYLFAGWMLIWILSVIHERRSR